MSNKPRKLKNKNSNTPKKVKAKKGFSFRRNHFFNLLVVVIVAVALYFAYAAFSSNQEKLNDLSVFGERKSVLVQIHDPFCSSCRVLLSSVESVIKEFPHMEYRIADMNMPQGRRFALQHQMGVTSLVHSSRSGKITKITGLQTKEEVRDFLTNVTH
jgi:hypothetical protein